MAYNIKNNKRLNAQFCNLINDLLKYIYTFLNHNEHQNKNEIGTTKYLKKRNIISIFIL